MRRRGGAGPRLMWRSCTGALGRTADSPTPPYGLRSGSVNDQNRFVGFLRRLKELALIGVFALALMFDLLVLVSRDDLAADMIAMVCGVAGFAAVLLRRRLLIPATAAFLATSLAGTIVAAQLDVMGHPGGAELSALLLLTISVLRRVRPFRTAAILVVGIVVVLEVIAVVRITGGREDSAAGLAMGFALFVLWSGAASVGGYLRYQYERREQAIESVRRAERLDIARELHDLVAHHITGIVVQAQAARAVGEQRPEAVLPALDAIATAGGDALTAMRRLVSVLRSDEEGSRTPGASLTDLRTLVDGFASASGARVAFDVGQGVSAADLPPEVLTTLHRVLQESLTNIRKHAPGTSWVEVDLTLVNGGVRLRVRNYGSTTGDPRLSRMGGGFGLVGMAERVEALGGTLTAGFTPQGAWEVCATLKYDHASARRPAS